MKNTLIVLSIGVIIFIIYRYMTKSNAPVTQPVKQTAEESGYRSVEECMSELMTAYPGMSGAQAKRACSATRAVPVYEKALS